MKILRFDSPEGLAVVEPLWHALHAHHVKITPALGGTTPGREPDDSWRRRRAAYESWLEDPQTFFLLAEKSGYPVGYAFVTVGPGFAAWATDGGLAELQTLVVLSGHRGKGIGASLLEAVWSGLAEIGVDDLSITAVIANADARRFYEHHGFTQSFVTYYGKRRQGARQAPHARSRMSAGPSIQTWT